MHVVMGTHRLPSPSTGFHRYCWDLKAAFFRRGNSPGEGIHFFLSHVCPLALPPAVETWFVPPATPASLDIYKIEKCHAGQLPLQKGAFHTCHGEEEDTDLTGSQVSELAPLLLASLLGDEWRSPKVRRSPLAAGRGWIQCSEAPPGMFSPDEDTWNLGSLSEGETHLSTPSRFCMRQSSKLGPATHWIPL